MVYIAIISLLLGVSCGYFLNGYSIITIITDNSNYILAILMFAVGISIGLNKQVFKKVKEYHMKIFIIPFGTIVGSVAGGALSSVLLRMPLNEGMAVASGMGWYSLSGVMITNLASSRLGTIAFISSLLREILSFIAIPFLVRTLNVYAAIAPAGATSEDTTLPMLIKYTNEEVVVLAIFHGVICSFMVPILIRFFLA
jgi:uncharacterized membrane protein YbjE (DUF340 family)